MKTRHPRGARRPFAWSGILMAVLALSLPAVGATLLDRKAWRVPSRKAAQKSPLQGIAADREMGAVVYGQECRSCHGLSGAGDGSGAADVEGGVPDFQGGVLSGQTDGALFYKIGSGRGSMPGYRRTLSETETWQVISYLRELAPVPAVEPRHPLTGAALPVLAESWQHYQALMVALDAGDLAGTRAPLKAIASLLDGTVEGLGPDAIESWTRNSAEISEALTALDPDGDLKSFRKSFMRLSFAYTCLLADFGPGSPIPIHVLQRTQRSGAERWAVPTGTMMDPFGGKPELVCLLKVIRPRRDLGSE